MTDDNDFEEDEEFYDSEAEPSICEDYADESIACGLNESIVCEPHVVKTYYAVQFKNSEEITDRIFMHQENAIKLLKKDPVNRRFKSFKSFKEAYAFSYESETSENMPTLFEVKASIDPLSDKKNTKESLSNNDAEKLPFSAPKKPEVNLLRMMIEKNQYEPFCERVLSNPRYLISAGDSPNLCQESFRYNCLHVCAKDNRFEICDFLLNLLNNSCYIRKLYKNDSVEQSKIRSNHLLDLYLNMPEKGLNETPLHFACKFGSLEVTRILLSFEKCNKTVKNKHGKIPEDLICTKAKTQNNLEAIKNLFENCFYVPLYRDDERGDVIVDKPSPSLNYSLKPTNNHSENHLSVNKFSPSVSYESNRKLAAYVGPVSPKNANAIYDRLKSPARLRQSPNNLDILRSDDYKGYERIVRQVTEELKLPSPTEFWAFLNCYSNLKSKEGLSKLEIYLEQKKVQSVLDLQKRSAINIKNEQSLNIFNQAKRNIEFIAKLEELIEVIDKLKTTLDLKENILSFKYEKFIQNSKECSKVKISDVDNHNMINAEALKELLQSYMDIIIAACKLNKESTQCYFDIYKISKTVFDLLYFEDIFSNLSFSPPNIQKNSTLPRASTRKHESKNFGTLERKKTTKRLTPKKEITNPFLQMRTSKPAYGYNSDDDDEEDDGTRRNTANSSEDEDYSAEIARNMKPTIVIQNMDSEAVNEAQSDNLDFLISKLNTGMKLEEGRKFKTTDDEGYSLNNVDHLKPVFIGFKKPADIKGICKKSQQFRLFMYGDAPSKLDRSVYQTIMGMNQEDLENHKLLNEWFNYMKSCNKKEMNDWKTPMRKQIHFNQL